MTAHSSGCWCSCSDGCGVDDKAGRVSICGQGVKSIDEDRV